MKYALDEAARFYDFVYGDGTPLNALGKVAFFPWFACTAILIFVFALLFVKRKQAK